MVSFSGTLSAAFSHTTRSDTLLEKTSITEEEWATVLKLSDMWDSFDIRKLAIKEMSNIEMHPVTEVLLARQYTIRKWLISGYEELVTRGEVISVDEAEKLGLETAILIFHIREKHTAGGRGIRCGGYAGIIEEVFAKQLKDVEDPRMAWMDENDDGPSKSSCSEESVLEAVPPGSVTEFRD
jgi:hypothetical protein